MNQLVKGNFKLSKFIFCFAIILALSSSVVLARWASSKAKCTEGSYTIRNRTPDEIQVIYRNPKAGNLEPDRASAGGTLYTRVARHFFLQPGQDNSFPHYSVPSAGLIGCYHGEIVIYHEESNSTITIGNGEKKDIYLKSAKKTQDPEALQENGTWEITFDENSRTLGLK